jgi:hypothetical protein
MGAGELFDPSTLPSPDVLRRRHLALVLVEAALGSQSEFRCFEADESGDCLTFADGSGNEYQLSRRTDSRAVLAVFDHESPYSPWSHPARPVDWPGMLDGFPADLSEHLPQRDGPEWPRSITACYWYSRDRWEMGNPDPAPDAEQWAEPQGVGPLLAPILDATGDEAGRYVHEYWERPEAVAPAVALFAAIDGGQHLQESHLTALGVTDAAPLI